MKLLELLRRSKVSGDEIEKALEQAMREHEAALEEQAAASKAYAESLLDDDPRKSAAAASRQGAATVRVDRAAALQDALTARLAEVREAEDGRRRAYRDTERQAKAARTALRSQYQEIVKLTHEMLGQLARAQLAVAQVNADLPAGAEPLPDPEQDVRGLPARPQTNTRTTVDEVWCFQGSDTPVAPDQVDRIVKDPGGQTGQISMTGTKDGYTAQRDFKVMLRRRRRTEYVAHVPAYVADPLRGTIFLPEFMPGEQPAWPGAELEQVLPTLAEPATGSVDPRHVPLPEVRLEWEPEPTKTMAEAASAALPG